MMGEVNWKQGHNSDESVKSGIDIKTILLLSSTHYRCAEDCRII